MSRGIKNFRTIMTLLLAALNLLHVFWTVWAIISGGDLEMMALLPWIFIEMPSVPIVLAEIIFIVLARKNLRNCKLNISLFALYELQVATFNILLFL